MTSKALCLHNIFKPIFLFLLVFCFQIPIQLTIQGIHIRISLFVIFVLFSIHIIEIISKKRIDKTLLRLYLWFYFLLFYYLIISGTNGLVDVDVCKYTCYGAIVLGGSFLLVEIFWLTFDLLFVEKVMFYFVASASVHGIIMLLTLLSPSFSSFLYSYVLIDEDVLNYLELGLRASGLFNSGLAILSFYNAMALTMGAFLFCLKKEPLGYTKILINFFILFSLVLGIAISGRTGLFIGLLGFCFLFVYSLLSRFRRQAFWNIFRLGLIALLFLLPLISWIYQTGGNANVQWLFEFAFKGGKTNSTEYIMNNMFFLPENAVSIFFGTGNFGRSDGLPRINSDLGYILMIHFSGLIGLILSLAFFAWIGREIFFDCYDARIRALGVFFLSAMALGNFKDVYFFSYSGYTQLFFVTTCLAIKVNRLKLEMAKTI